MRDRRRCLRWLLGVAFGGPELARAAASGMQVLRPSLAPLPAVALQTMAGESRMLARIFHRSRATNEYGIALVCPKIQVSNLDQRAGNAEAKLYRRN